MRRNERRPQKGTEEWVEVVKSRAMYNSGERFSAAAMGSAIDNTSPKALEILHLMTERGLVHVTTEIRGSSQMYWYTKAKPGIDPSKIPWRKHPDFHPMPSRWQIGAPI